MWGTTNVYHCTLFEESILDGTCTGLYQYMSLYWPIRSIIIVSFYLSTYYYYMHITYLLAINKTYKTGNSMLNEESYKNIVRMILPVLLFHHYLYPSGTISYFEKFKYQVVHLCGVNGG